MPNDIIIGLMSGTSVDGIDASLVSFKSENELQLINTLSLPFDSNLKQKINQLALSECQLQPQDYAELDHILGVTYANACQRLIEKSAYSKTDISAIANHGQTIRHEPDACPAYSLQIGDAQLIANLTGIKTIANFRQADIQYGGQGAPLMPAFHQAIFNHDSSHSTSLVVNIGGIANITQLGERVIGFDTGPGNTLLDQWITKCLGKKYDHNGEWAKEGNICPSALNKLLDDPYFSLPFPKSTGTDYFNLAWLKQQLGDLEKWTAADLQATLTALTTESIALGVEQLSHSSNRSQQDLFLCGGGAHNKTLVDSLKHRLPNAIVQPSDALGIATDWVESIGFAWLGYCKLHQICSNLPSVTGASRSLVLGELYQPID